MSNIVASQARTVYASTGGTTIRGRAERTSGDTVSTSSTGLLLGYLFHSFVKVNYRSFLNFDLSGESGTVTAVSLTLTRRNATAFPDLFVLASEAGNDLATAHYLNGIVGASSYPFTSDATKFTDSAHSPNDGGGDDDTITINLNASAVSHANAVIGTSNRFKCAIVNASDFNDTYDADDDGYSAILSHQGIEVDSTDSGDSSNHPVLNLTFSALIPPTKLQIKGGNLTLNGGNLTIK